jgi:hypothetical protein
VLRELTDQGNALIVIEHNLEVIGIPVTSSAGCSTTT